LSRSFNQQLDQHGAWRSNFAHRLQWLSRWLTENELLDQAVAERLRGLELQIRNSKVMVAFVAEFSRGKSELINAIFFAGYGRRIMPASAGRTTMCPTELGYDAAVSPKLRLLPIETRLEPHSLTHWREKPTRWTEIAIDVENAEQLAQAMGKVAEVRWVSKDEANALGFWNEETPDDNPVQDAEGRVEIPRWRHAILNMPHPLLEQGLVILDTPGLNAIGAEPELTVSLIPQAHAVVFILGAETGVTRSDLSIWREHLVTESEGSDTRFVVLNKIDTMWDTLSTPAQIEMQIERQREVAAKFLEVPLVQVLPVSAQKGLQAKIQRDGRLLEASRLLALETLLAEGVLGKRETMLRLAVDAGMVALYASAIFPSRRSNCRGCAARTFPSSATCVRASTRSRPSSKAATRASSRCAPCRASCCARYMPCSAVPRSRPTWCGFRPRSSAPASSSTCARCTARPSILCATTCAKCRRPRPRSSRCCTPPFVSSTRSRASTCRRLRSPT
jgi:hypothetical protein